MALTCKRACPLQGHLLQSQGRPQATYPCVQEASLQARRRISVVREAGAAPCHTISPAYPEGRYLSNVLLCVH